jgi:hypothetical protein
MASRDAKEVGIVKRTRIKRREKKERGKKRKEKKRKREQDISSLNINLFVTSNLFPYQH